MASNDTLDERWCTTPFTTRTLKVDSVGKTFLFIFDILILFVNVLFSFTGICALRATRRFRIKPSLLLIFYLFVNDSVFTITAQLLYAFKLVTPNLRCNYDLVFSFIITWLANTSLVMVMFVAIIRLISTKYLFRTSQLINKFRARVSILVALMCSLLLSSTLIIGSSLNIYYLIHFPTCLSDILVPLTIPLVYYRAMKIALARRHASTVRSKSITVDTLKRCSYYTLVTFVPARIGFFASSTYKMVNVRIYENPSDSEFQLAHSVCYLIFCLSPVGNSLAYFLNNLQARLFAYRVWERFKSYFQATTVAPEESDSQPTM